MKVKSNQAKTFGNLTRRDLTAFDREAKDMVIKAIDVGCTGRVSSRGHVILRNNTGATTAIPRNMTAPNRSSQNARADFRRFLASHDEQAAGTGVQKPSAPRQMTVSQALMNYSAPFTSWFDAQPGGLPANAKVEVSFGTDQSPSFRLISLPPAPEPTPTPSPNQPQKEDPTVTSTAVKTDPQDPATTVQRVREALGEDPQIAQLESEVEKLTRERDGFKRRAEAAEQTITAMKKMLDK